MRFVFGRNAAHALTPFLSHLRGGSSRARHVRISGAFADQARPCELQPQCEVFWRGKQDSGICMMRACPSSAIRSKIFKIDAAVALSFAVLAAVHNRRPPRLDDKPTGKLIKDMRILLTRTVPRIIVLCGQGGARNRTWVSTIAEGAPDYRRPRRL